MLFVDSDQPIIKYLQKAQYDTDCEIGQQAHAGLISIEGGEDADEVISRFMRWLHATVPGPAICYQLRTLQDIWRVSIAGVFGKKANFLQ